MKKHNKLGNNNHQDRSTSISGPTELKSLIDTLDFSDLSGDKINNLDKKLLEIKNFISNKGQEHKTLCDELDEKINRTTIKNIVNLNNPTGKNILKNLIAISTSVDLVFINMYLEQAFDQQQIQTIELWFKSLKNPNDREAKYESIQTPPSNSAELLNYAQIRYIATLLSRGIVTNTPVSGTKYMLLSDTNTVVRLTGAFMPDGGRATNQDAGANHIINNFWEALFNYYKDQQEIPEKIRLISNANFNNEHWTAVISDIELDPQQKANISNAYENARINCECEGDTLTADKLIQSYDALLRYTKKIPHSKLPVKTISIKHYNSTNPDGQCDLDNDTDTHTRLGKSCQKLQTDNPSAKFELTSERCIAQHFNTCGDWSALNGFVAGILEQNPVNIDKQKINDIRNQISIKCFNVEQEIRQTQEITSQNKEIINNMVKMIQNALPNAKSSDAKVIAPTSSQSSQENNTTLIQSPAPSSAHNKAVTITPTVTAPTSSQSSQENNTTLIQSPTPSRANNKAVTITHTVTAPTSSQSSQENNTTLIQSPTHKKIVSPLPSKPQKKSNPKYPDSILPENEIDPNKLDHYLNVSTKQLSGYEYISSISSKIKVLASKGSDKELIGTVKKSDYSSVSTKNQSFKKRTKLETIAKIFTFNKQKNKLRFQFPTKNGSMSNKQQDWLIKFFHDLPLEPNLQSTIIVNKIKPADLQQILTAIDKINRTNKKKILSKFQCTSEDSSYAAIKNNIEIHNLNIDKLRANPSADLVPLQQSLTSNTYMPIPPTNGYIPSSTTVSPKSLPAKATTSTRRKQRNH